MRSLEQVRALIAGKHFHRHAWWDAPARYSGFRVGKNDGLPLLVARWEVSRLMAVPWGGPR
jgi:hypothetical protein